MLKICSISEFFFDSGALQNYFAEILSITITVVLINRIIRFQLKKKNTPINNSAYSLLWNRIENFLVDFVPIELTRVSIGWIHFREYTSIVLFFPENFDNFNLSCALEKAEKFEKESIDMLASSNEIILRKIHDKNKELVKLSKYENELQQFIKMYGYVLEHRIIELIHKIIYEINKYYYTYPKQLKDIDEFKNLNLSHLISKLVKISIEIRDILKSKSTNK